MSSADVIFGAADAAEAIAKRKSDEVEENVCDQILSELEQDTKMEGIEVAEPPKSPTDGSLFELSGVDFVSEGKYIFGRPDENDWRGLSPKSTDTDPTLKIAEGKIDEGQRGSIRTRTPENETGDAGSAVVQLQVPQKEEEEEKEVIDKGTDDSVEVDGGTEESEILCEKDDKPIVRRQLKNFKLNEEILSQIFSERSDFETEPEPASSSIEKGTTNHQLSQMSSFNDSRSRPYTLPFKREELSGGLRNAASEELASFESRLVHDNPLSAAETPFQDGTDTYRGSPVRDVLPLTENSQTEEATKSVAGEFRPRPLRLFKTRSDLTVVDHPSSTALPLAPPVSSPCQIADSSGSLAAAEDQNINVTSDIDERVEDVIKTVEPVNSAVSVTSRRKGTAVVDSSTILSPKSAKESSMLRGQADDRVPFIDVINSEAYEDAEEETASFSLNIPDQLEMCHVPECSLPLPYKIEEISPLEPLSSSQGWHRKCEPRDSVSVCCSSESFHTYDRDDSSNEGSRTNFNEDKSNIWCDADAVSVSLSQKNSFISIDLDTRDSQRGALEDSNRRAGTVDVILGDDRDPSTIKRGRRSRIQESLKQGMNFANTKKNQSRILKLRKKVKHIYERVKENVTKKK